MSKEIVKTNLPEDITAFLEQQDTDFESSNDFIIPRLSIVQSLSAQRKPQHENYISGAEEGHIVEISSKKLYDGGEGISIVPIKYQMVYLEWADRDTGKGLIKNHGKDRTLFDKTPQNKKGKKVTPEGNTIMETAEYYVFIIDHENQTYAPAVVSMNSTQLKQAKIWNGLINNVMADMGGKKVHAPIFWCRYRLKTVPVSNQKGNWYRWAIEMESPLIKDDEFGIEILRAAKEFRESISSGAVKVAAHENEADQDSDETDEDPM